MSKTFYITTTLPYVNANPHIGFAMELIRADVIARYKKLLGFDVFFNTGTDEHGQKIYQNAVEVGKDTQEYVDGFAQRFKDLISVLGVSEDVKFIRTTDKDHIKSAQEFWKRCQENNDIYKKNYKVKYCVGCELEKQESDLIDGKCPDHLNSELEIREEENYFFRFSKYQKQLLDLYEKNPNFVIPNFRFNEIKKFVENGLEDFSISRVKEKMPWGIPVPDDNSQVFYVWFDALVNYISTLGWPSDEDKFNDFWVNGNPVQYCGKDNLRQQSAMWQVMLMSAGLPPSKTIVIDGFINSGGQKMSKSLGNVISPFDVVEEYSTDALRYYLLREISSFEDGDITMDKFKEAYNANLANGLGNLVSRILTMAEKYKVSYIDSIYDYSEPELEKFEMNKYMDSVWGDIQVLDKKIQEKEPFKLFKTDHEIAKEIVSDLMTGLSLIAKRLIPAMPETSKKILNLLKNSKKPEEPLFMRKD